MRWLLFLVLACLAVAARAETVRICYNYGCLAEAEAEFDEPQLARVRALLGTAASAEDERERLAVAIGWLLGWAGRQTPIAADRGGNYADDGVRGRMDCIDHSTTTTRLLRLLEARGWLRFHRVLDPVLRVRFLFDAHYSAQIEELPEVAGDEATADAAARHVVDSWFRDNGQPAVVLPLPRWLAGEGDVGGESTRVVSGPGEGVTVER
ncbi:hypothetical protein [Accumulibacter sp.]|uniref:hypothetical protein n=1 Tax=Accumulibacter sp. TaxID=2053492 RepID=UPI00261F5A4C|nr:hypothetical protein [Accumulibacter sp.]